MRNSTFGLGIAAVVVLIVAFLGFNTWASFGTKDTVTITVTDKERVTDRNSEDSRYLVWTNVTNDDGTTGSETFEVTDALLHGKFRASDTYGALTIGETYTVEVNGFRIGFFSSYRNILEITEKHTS